MNRKDIFETISLIDDELIAEASDSVRRLRHIRIRKIIVLAAAVVMLLSATVLAANIILGSRGGHSSNIPSYYSIPSKDTMLKDTGIAPSIPESFSSGFVFDSGYIMYNEDFDTEGNSVQEYKGLMFNYTNNGAEIPLYIDASIAGIQIKDPTATERYQGSELLYYSYINKLVPPDYRPTDADKKAEKDGSVILSYGSDKIELNNVQGVAWEYQGLNYELLAINTDISMDELFGMAKEVIDAQDTQ